jgi:hypothetical protein
VIVRGGRQMDSREWSHSKDATSIFASRVIRDRIGSTVSASRSRDMAASLRKYIHKKATWTLGVCI